MEWLHLFLYPLILHAFYVFVLYSHSTETLCTGTVLVLKPVLVLCFGCSPFGKAHCRLVFRISRSTLISIS
jgi:hypothetical protein